MAIYSFHCDITQRSKGQSSCNSAAYIIRGVIKDERTGITYDYRTRKDHQTVVASGTEIPTNADKSWRDPAALWNAAESYNNAKDARPQRRFIIALPKELTIEQNTTLAKNIVECFCDDGMACTWAVHVNKDGSNPHLHICATTFPCNKDGFTNKCQVAYLVRSRHCTSTEKWLTADEMKLQANAERFEKVFQYADDNGEVSWMSATEVKNAEQAGDISYTRVNRYPKKQKVGAKSLDSKEQLITWREDTADLINGYLKLHNHEERVSDKSYAAQGINRIPQVHLGGAVCRKEKEERERCEKLGIPYEPITDRARWNAYAKAANKKIINFEDAKKKSEQRAKEQAQTKATQEAKAKAQKEYQEQQQRQYQQRQQQQKRLKVRDVHAASIADMMIWHEINEAEQNREDRNDDYGREII